MPITVLDSNGVEQSIETGTTVGRKTADNSKPVTLSTEDLAAVSALLTDAQLRATAVPVSGTFWPATQPVSGTVSISGGVNVAGTFWQATQPISGNVGITGTVSVAGTFWQATQPVSVASLPLPTGAATAAKQDEVTAAVNGLVGTEYETVAASATNQTIGTTGAVGDLLMSILIVPATLSPGAVSIKDGAGSAIAVFPGGTNSVATLHPFSVALGIKSAAGAWQVSTGANVSAIASGNFT